MSELISTRNGVPPDPPDPPKIIAPEAEEPQATADEPEPPPKRSHHRHKP